jgi:hypothetical protein
MEVADERVAGEPGSVEISVEASALVNTGLADPAARLPIDRKPVATKNATLIARPRRGRSKPELICTTGTG